MNTKELEANYCAYAAYVSKTQWTEIIRPTLLGITRDESDVLGRLGEHKVGSTVW